VLKRGVVTNASLVAGLILGLVFLLAGLLLWSRAHSGGAVVVTAGALLTLGAAVYALAVLRPFVGRVYDEQWSQQIATVEALATLGLLICAAGMVAHGLALPRR
jgi:fucose permease